MTEADVLTCLEVFEKNATCTVLGSPSDLDTALAECGADITVPVGWLVFGGVTLCLTAGFLGDLAKGVLDHMPHLGANGEAKHKRHGQLEVALVLVEDFPMLLLTLYIEYVVKPPALPAGEPSVSTLAILSMVFGAVNGMVRAIAGVNEFTHAKLLAEQDAAADRTENVLHMKDTYGELAKDLQTAFSASSDTTTKLWRCPPPGGCARGGGQWAGTHGPPRSVPARRVEEDNGTR